MRGTHQVHHSIFLSLFIALLPMAIAQASALPSQCGSGSYTDRIDVRSASELTSALQNAQPGDLIMLADGTYSDRFDTNRDGTSSQPIIICGSRNAILDGGDYSSGYGFHLTADHYILHGFTIRDSLMGLVLDNADHNILRDLEVHRSGQEAVHFRTHSSNNVLRDSEIHRTGLKVAGYGEGIYVGSAKSNWDKYTNNKPDQSDNNKIINNSLYDVTAELIDIKEGTRGTLVESNTFDGTGVSGEHYADSWVDIKGNDVIIRGNHGFNNGSHIKDGYQTHVQLDGWGSNISFEKNTMEVNGSGYGIWIHSSSSNVSITCDNTVSGADKGLSNVNCSGSSSWDGSSSDGGSSNGGTNDPATGTLKNYASMENLIWMSATEYRHPADNLFDGCTKGTKDCTTASLGNNDWTGVFDLGEIRDLGKLRVFGDASGNWTSEAIDIEIKSNGSDAYTSIYNYENIKVNDWVEFDLSGLKARYVRIRIHHPADYPAQARELEILAYENSSESAGESTPIQNYASMNNLIWVSETDYRHPVDNLFDGCTKGTQECSTASNGNTDWTGVFDLGDIKNLSQVRVFGDASGNWTSEAIDIEIKSDGSDAYTSIYNYENIKVNDWVEFDLSGLKARYIRIRIHHPADHPAQARELEILAD